jgi:hypothetical protein
MDPLVLLIDSHQRKSVKINFKVYIQSVLLVFFDSCIDANSIDIKIRKPTDKLISSQES